MLKQSSQDHATTLEQTPGVQGGGRKEKPSCANQLRNRSTRSVARAMHFLAPAATRQAHCVRSLYPVSSIRSASGPEEQKKTSWRLGLLFWLFKGLSKSVQVLFHGREDLVRTLTILKQQAL